MSALKSRISELLSTHKARKTLTITALVIIILSVILFSFANIFSNYIQLRLFVASAESEKGISYYTHSIQYGELIKSKEKYYIPGDDYFRFVSIEGSKFYTVFYSEGTAYLSFDTELKTSWIIDESLLEKDELKNYISEKVSWIKDTIDSGIRNIGFIINIEKYSEDETDIVGAGPKIITIKSKFEDKNVEAVHTQESNKYYLNYSEGSEYFYLSTERLSTKTDEVNGTISTEEEFDKLMEENGINTTFSEIFGK